MRKEYASLRRRPLLAPVWIAALAGLVVIALGFWLVTAASTTTVFVMRHAEKLTVNPDDPDPALGSVSPESRRLAEQSQRDVELLLAARAGGNGTSGSSPFAWRRSKSSSRTMSVCTPASAATTRE